MVCRLDVSRIPFTTNAIESLNGDLLELLRIDWQLPTENATSALQKFGCTNQSKNWQKH
jgi:hypothetical protein